MLPENDEIRTALLQSGKQQFLAHGFDRASLRVICRNANVTTGAFYSHFEKKEDLFCSIVEPSVSAFRELFNSAAERNAASLGSVEDVADAVYYLSQARFVTGQVLCCDGGYL